MLASIYLITYPYQLFLPPFILVALFLFVTYTSAMHILMGRKERDDDDDDNTKVILEYWSNLHRKILS